MRVAIYARVSTKDQQTIPMQVDHLKQYSQLRGWEVTQVFEEKKSGSNDRRPQYSALMQEARQRKIDVVLVWKLDRWGRNLKDLVTSMQELRELGIDFVSFKESLDMTTSHGRAMAGMISVFAVFEREQLGDRVRSGLNQAKKNGVEVGRPPKIDEKMIAKAKALQESGFSHNQIMRELELGKGTIYKILGNSTIKKGRPLKNKEIVDDEIIEDEELVKEIYESKLLPATLQDKIHYAEITEDEPKSPYDIEVEEWAAHRDSEDGVYEEYHHQKNIKLHYQYDFSDGYDDEYWRVRKYIFEKQELEERGWNAGAIRKFLGSPNFVVHNKYYAPAHFWFKKDATPFESKPEFKEFLEKSEKAKEKKKIVEAAKQEKTIAARKIREQEEKKKIEEYKKSKQKKGPKIAQIELNISIENNSKFVRMKGKVLKEIQNYVLRDFDYKKEDERTYILKIPYNSNKELDGIIEELLQEIWHTADSDNCFSESSAYEIDGERHW